MLTMRSNSGAKSRLRRTLVTRSMMGRVYHEPKTPHVRALVLLARGVPERGGGHAAGVEPLVQAVHQLALAAGIAAGDDDNHLPIGALQREMRLQQGRAKATETAFVGGL
jgi:hypothetical protein